MQYVFNILEFIFPILFFIVLGAMIVRIIKIIGEWNHNNHSPRLTEKMTIINMRTKVSSFDNSNPGSMNGIPGRVLTTSTSYYITFQSSDGKRMELKVNGSQYGMMALGDIGILTYQGTRFISFNLD